MLNSFIYDFSWCPTPFILLTYPQIHTLSVFFFNPLWQCWSNISNTCKLFLYLFFVRINCHHISPWITKNWTSFACYHPIFTFHLGCTEAESSLLFVLGGGLFWLIVRVIFNYFNINVPFFISWLPYVVFITLACHRWSTDLLDVELIKENE